MAKKQFDLPTDPAIKGDETDNVIERVTDETLPPPVDEISIKPDDEIIDDIPGTDTTVHGLNDIEARDPNSIVVTIADQNVPIIVLFGPTECGKTMTLIRLTRFLQQYGFRVSPIKSFRPAQDKHYAKMCAEYNELVHSSNAAEGTQMISFMLVEVLTQQGKRICQILEAPGEYYFNPKKPQQPFPAYVNTIISSKNRKIWVYMVEPDWQDLPDRSAYVSRLQQLKTMMKPQDQAVFLYNKVDKSNFIISPGVVNMAGVKNDIANMYPGIFTPFTNQNPITKWFKPYNCDLIPFSNGFFVEATDNKGQTYLTYQQGPDEYPQMLWKVLMKKIRG